MTKNELKDLALACGASDTDMQAVAVSTAQKALIAEVSTPEEWLTHLHGARTKEIAEITKTLSLLLDRLEVSGPAELSKDLGKVDVENVHPYHLLAVLRFLFNQRHSIPNWHSLERRTRVVFEKKGMNPSCVMKGLDIDGDVGLALLDEVAAEPLYEGPEKGYVRFDIPAAECFTCDHFDYTMYTCMDCERSDYALELIEHKEDCRVAAALKQL